VRFARDERREARDELMHQARYYESQRAGLGLDFLDAVDTALTGIEHFPDAWRAYPGWDREPVVRVQQVEGFPIGVVYLIDRGRIVVLAYTHHRRKPGYWLNRIDG